MRGPESNSLLKSEAVRSFSSRCCNRKFSHFRRVKRLLVSHRLCWMSFYMRLPLLKESGTLRDSKSRTIKGDEKSSRSIWRGFEIVDSKRLTSAFMEINLSLRASVKDPR